jgi:hypothetical protein
MIEEGVKINPGYEHNLVINKINNNKQIKVTDLCSGSFIIFISLGDFMGPIIVTQLLERYSWPMSCFLFQIFMAAMGYQYYSVYGWPALNSASHLD